MELPLEGDKFFRNIRFVPLPLLNYEATLIFCNFVSLLIWIDLCAGENFKEITATPRTFQFSRPWIYGRLR